MNKRVLALSMISVGLMITGVGIGVTIAKDRKEVA